MPSTDDVVVVAPTNTTYSLLRGGAGAFGAPRSSGTHAGIDIVANQSSMDKTIYAVSATANGTVAYARVNGLPGQGYGYTIVVDHGNGLYTLYAHLAQNATSAVGLAIGSPVAQGQLIGYMADLASGEKSSGNVLSRVVAQYDKIQLHFECFEAPAGRTSTDSLAVIKQGGILHDPTSSLTALGYQSF